MSVGSWIKLQGQRSDHGEFECGKPDVVSGYFHVITNWSAYIFFQKLQSQHAESTSALKKSQSKQHTQLSSAIGAEQSSLAQSRKEIADWSESVSADLQKRDADVEKFLTEDLTKDVPTGLQNVLI